ncbi:MULTISPECIES: DUF3047 domain-containing protein [unclassified Variovorax]|uniref:DUF3047 domain-containing protein n=1 Tax=unclassified Variovorax TaxID=663243 RepID=UPI001BD1F66E|nr:MULTISPECIES: DUF3047 domain-containing protein [unclassified Variovorax]
MFSTEGSSGIPLRQQQQQGLRHGPAVAAALCLIGFAALAQAEESIRAFSNAIGDQPPAPWHFSGLPNKVPTRFEIVQQGSQRVLKVESDKSYGTLVHRTLVPLQRDPTLTWRWRVEQFVQGTDLHAKSGDDSAAKLCLFFNLPSERLSVTERAQLKLARALSGEDVPTEILCYVWDAREPKGSQFVNAFTNRMQMLVLQSGPTTASGGWVSEKRNVLEDYRRAFGREAGTTVPDVAAVAVAADSDNTQGHGLSFFSDIDLRANAPAEIVGAKSAPAPGAAE